MNKKLIIVIGILLVVVLAHGSHSHSHTEDEHPYFKQVKNYMQKNVTSKYGQVALSIFIISFPSIPVFFSLSFLGRVLKKKGDKNNFSSSLLTLLLAFACGTLLGDVMLHILPYLFSAQPHSHGHVENHHHSHHVESHQHHHTVELNQKPSGCPFANLFGQGKENPNIPNDAAHAHLHDHLHEHEHTHANEQNNHNVNEQAKQNQHQHETQGHAHDHAHTNDHLHNHDHDHDHEHHHDHDHGHHKCNHNHDHLPGTPKEQVHAHLNILKQEGEELLHPEHNHDHGHGHAHTIDQMIVPLMIIGGIIIFIILDYIFMKIHKSSSSKKDKKQKAVKVEEKGDKSKIEGSKEKQDKGEEECDSDSEGHGHSHHHHSHDEEEEHSAVPFLIGDFLHNFTDGLAIGAAYTVSFQMGITSTFVIMIHELPHEIGDFAHLIKYNYTLSRILKTQFLTSFGALVGGFLGLFTGEIYKRELLSITAGGFLYMCLANVVPEIQADLKKDHSIKNLISVVISLSVGVGLMIYVAMLE